MIFDRLCSAVEKVPELRKIAPVLRRARIFQFPLPAHKVTELLDFNSEAALYQWEHFFLPFPVVAVEDPLSCILLWGASDDQRGLQKTRWYAVECLLFEAPMDAAADEAELEAKYGARVLGGSKHEVIVSMGWVEGERLEDAEKFGASFGGSLTRCAAVDTKKGRLLAPLNAPLDGPPGMTETVVTAFVRNVRAAIEELIVFNSPNRFVVEKTRLNARKPKHGSLARSDARSVYDMRTVTEIRAHMPQSMQRSDGLAKGRKVTERRAHERHYPDDKARWPNAAGTSVLIPATWVGPSEYTIGSHVYKVRLDL